MIKFILIRLWPIFIPAILYFVILLILKKAKKKNKKNVAKANRFLLYSTFFAAIITITSIAYSINLESETYIPPYFENGVLQPSKIQ